MNTTVGKLTIAAAMTLALAIAPTVQASDKGCSNETLRGSYAQIGSGVVTAPPDQAGPFAQCRDAYLRRKRWSYRRVSREQ